MQTGFGGFEDPMSAGSSSTARKEQMQLTGARIYSNKAWGLFYIDALKRKTGKQLRRKTNHIVSDASVMTGTSSEPPQKLLVLFKVSFCLIKKKKKQLKASSCLDVITQTHHRRFPSPNFGVTAENGRLAFQPPNGFVSLLYKNTDVSKAVEIPA